MAKMNRQKRRKIGLFLAILFVISFMLVLKWGTLSRQEVDYGRPFNIERARLNLPLIEHYFVPKYKEGDGIQIWSTPDSLRNIYLHSGKNYWLKKGRINIEADYFSRKQDSVIQELAREYYYMKDSVSYILTVLKGDEKVSIDTISRIEGDNLLLEWASKGN